MTQSIKTQPKPKQREWEERLSEFYKEELIVCSKCGHSKESHYWNGGGRPENSGYDACHSCDCSCMGDEVVKEYIQDHKYMTDFISQELQKQKEEIANWSKEWLKRNGEQCDIGTAIAYSAGLRQTLKKMEEK